MEYIVMVICIVIGIIFYVNRRSSKKNVNKTKDVGNSQSNNYAELVKQRPEKFVIKMKILPAEMVFNKSELAEIKNNRVLAHINNLVPELARLTNDIKNVAKAAELHGKQLYEVIIPAGTKLVDSKLHKGAFRGFFRIGNKIGGNAEFKIAKTNQIESIVDNSTAAVMNVASMIVGQYYMDQINNKLEEIGNNVLKIFEFQNNEYRSRVFSLITHVKKIAEFQVEILENDELRKGKISQLDNLEGECTKLLGQANLTLANYAGKRNLSYKEYEKEIKEVQGWYEYQQSLIKLLHKISELTYTLHFGNVSRDQCITSFNTYNKQATDIQNRLIKWHNDIIKKLNINISEAYIERMGFDKIAFFIPGIFNEKLKYKSIDENIVNMINMQINQNKEVETDGFNLYKEDVKIIYKDGKIYYLPEKSNRK